MSGVDDVHRVLRALVVQRRPIRDVADDVAATGVDVFVGALTDLFLAVAGRRFTGHESRTELTTAIRRLRRRYAYLRPLDVPAAVHHLHAGLRGHHPPEPVRLDTLVEVALLLTRAIAEDTRLTGDELEIYVLSAAGRSCAP
ncbi:hypothetical protein [Saccharomonospora sp. NB11]|jgi:hypothetical protein|uniref:hypothetical protein n=1 Tax=Saccharomonospora sp. NB11 TaxID=1642298 RepID=UPI001E347061|nr:hypothetical protein [Saccharomonospora sp. NB11]